MLYIPSPNLRWHKELNSDPIFCPDHWVLFYGVFYQDANILSMNEIVHLFVQPERSKRENHEL